MFIPLEPGESVILQVHKHWWFIFVRVIGLLLFLAVPFVLWSVLSRLGFVVFVGASTAGFVALGALWTLVGWVMFWQFWTLYYMDMWIVTDRRLIDIDYVGFFDRNIAMLRLDKIQDLTVQVRGIMSSLLGYGHILVQTAGTQEQFVIDQISEPEKLRDKISELIPT